jgi:predicted metal-dependent enzyme (double-stranded beta helix superfamily)
MQQGGTSVNECPSLQPLIDELRTIWKAESDIEQRMRRAKPVIERFIAQPAFCERTRAWPMTPRQNLLFYEDPDYGFALNGTVRKAGSPGGPHDHAHAWTLYGIVEGNESMERYERLDDGSRKGFAKIRPTSVTPGSGGDVDLVEPYAIHCEQAGPERSAALILRSERLVGKTLQQIFNPANDTVAAANGPEQVPYSF